MYMLQTRQQAAVQVASVDGSAGGVVVPDVSSPPAPNPAQLMRALTLPHADTDAACVSVAAAANGACT